MVFNLSLDGWEGFSYVEIRAKVICRDTEARKHKSQIVNREELPWCVMLSGSSELIAHLPCLAFQKPRKMKNL